MDQTQAQYTYLTETPVKKLLFQLAIPTTLSVLISSIYNLADTFFVGQIGTSASGAIGIVASLMAIIQAIGFMYGHGSGGIVSRKLGAKDTEAATRFVSTGFFAAVFCGSILSILGLSFLSPLMTLLGSTPTILPHACDYAKYILLAAPIMMSSLVLNNNLRYEGKAKFSMIGLVTGGILNMILDPIFIFGFHMGTAGAGLATALSQCVSFCILLSMFLRGKTISKISIREVTKDYKEFLLILATGAPNFGRQGLGSIAGMLLNIAASAYGDAAVAAMSIVTRIFMFLTSITIGIGQGLQPIAAFNYGAKKYKRVKDACISMMQFSLCIMTVSVTTCLVFQQPLIQLFRDDPAVIELALPAFRYQCLVGLVFPISTAANMTFQSIGKTNYATFLACCRQGIFFLPLIFILPYFFGMTGIQLVQPISDALTFIVSVSLLIPLLRSLGE